MQKQQPLLLSKEPQPHQSQHQSPNVFNKILQFLKEKTIPFQLIEHQSASTSAQSAQIRNTPLQWGSKTMLVRGKSSEIIMLLYRANSKISWNKVKKIDIVGKKSRMVTKEQLYEQFGLLPGAVPPFVNVLKIKGIIDANFSLEEKMAFNAGLKSKSMIMNFKDFPLDGFEKFDITQDEDSKEVAK